MHNIHEVPEFPPENVNRDRGAPENKHSLMFRKGFILRSNFHQTVMDDRKMPEIDLAHQFINKVIHRICAYPS
jgi:hypothetical protein